MYYAVDQQRKEFSPRLIVWRVALSRYNEVEDVKPFTTHECLLTIDSIVRTSKPIVVLTGEKVIQRTDLYEIVEYGVALGAKMIVEVRPEDLSADILQRFHVFGPKVLRLAIDECIVEDATTRYRQSPQFAVLEAAVRQLRKSGYEIHLGVTTMSPIVRQLAFEHDYAFRCAANGLYCHLCLDGNASPEVDQDERHVDEFIEAIAKAKSVSPKNMYVSPQCIKYGHAGGEDDADEQSDMLWSHWCLGGKSVAFINLNGIVQVCSGLQNECGDLRKNRYDFKSIWEKSVVFQQLRKCTQTCSETREMCKAEATHESEDNKK